MTCPAAEVLAKDTHPEEPVPPAEPGSTDGSLQHRQLMTEDDILKREGGGVDEEGADEGPDTEDEDHHGSRSGGMRAAPQLYPQAYRRVVRAQSREAEWSFGPGQDARLDRFRALQRHWTPPAV